MSKLAELLAKQEEISEQIKEAKKAERDEALATVKALCKQHGFTAGMLKGALAKGRAKKTKSDEAN
jgi:hypothetical protein